MSKDYTPTAEQLFGAHPWIVNPAMTGEAGDYTLSQTLFATQDTAKAIAAMIQGAKVASAFSFETAGLSTQHQANMMIQMPNGALLNAGKLAAMFTGTASTDAIQAQFVQEVVEVSQEMLGITVDPATVVVTMPAPPAAPVAPSVMPGSFGRRLNTDQFVMNFPPDLPQAESNFFVGFFSPMKMRGPDNRVYGNDCHLTSPLSDPGRQQPTGIWTALNPQPAVVN